MSGGRHDISTKNGAGLAFGLILLSTTPALADPNICPQGPVAIHVQLLTDPPALSTDKPAHDIATLAGATGTPTGMTIPGWQPQLEVKYKRSNLWNVACTEAQEATYTVHYKAAVYIAAELKDFPCQYKAASDAEQEHINAGYLVMKDGMPRIEKALGDYFSHLPLKAPTTVAGMDDRQKEIDDGARRAGQSILDEVKSQYEKEQAAAAAPVADCPNEHPLP